MREKSITSAIDLLNLLMYYFISCCIMIPLLYALSRSYQASFLLSICLLPAILLSYLMRQKIKHLWVYISLHLCMITAYVLLPFSIYIKLLLLGYTFIVSAINLYRRINSPRHDTMNASPVLLLIVAVSYLFCSKYNLSYIPTYLQYGLLFCALCYSLNSYLLNYRSYFVTNIEKANVPMSQIQKVSNLLISGFLCISAFLMFLLSKLPIQAFLAGIKRVLFHFLRWFFSLFHFKEGEYAADLMTEEEKAAEDPDLTFLLDPDAKESRFWYYFEKIAFVLFYTALIVGFIVLIIVICYTIYKKFHLQEPDGTTEEKEFISPFSIKKEKAKKSGIVKPPKSFFLFSSTRDKMRRHFFHLMKPRIDQEHAAYYTSKEMTDSLNDATGQLLPSSGTDEDHLKLHHMYDKARYSNEECTRQDYQRMKKIKL